MSKPRLIAFYLPQFYPTPENDEWWEPGFTEWTNVAKAKPLFKGHYQPRIPQELGFYDLRVPETRERQAELAHKAGIEGFCYWHYWFAGRRLLDRVFNEVLESGKPDFPFCLCWANHDWQKKTWDQSNSGQMLIEQTYPGVDDYTNHFYAMLPAFKDHRYIKVNGKLLYGIFAPLNMGAERFLTFKETWDKLAKANDLPGFTFFGFTTSKKSTSVIYNFGFDYIVLDFMGELFNQRRLDINVYNRIKRAIFDVPDKVFKYSEYADKITLLVDNPEKVIPCLIPCFDHSPRSKSRGYILTDESPEKWADLLYKTFNMCKDRDADNNVVFIKSWNEWGEGNYLEPDRKYGRKFIEETRRVLELF